MAELDELIERQRGVLTRDQALRHGMSAGSLRAELAAGRWQRLSAGAYATFTGDVPPAALRWAAVLRAGAGAMLSHRSAAEEAGIVDEDPGGPIHLTIPAHRRIVVASGVVAHRVRRSAERRHPTRLPPQTRVEDTVIDLVCSTIPASEEAAMKWIAVACGRRLTTPERIAAALDRRARAPRRGELAGLLDDVRAGCVSLQE